MTRDLYCRTTESLIVSERTKFYPAKIPVPHHQLRHFISTAEQDLIYYADKNDIYVLNPRAAQRSLVATLPFEARCLAVNHGWICVGGEVNGDCAFLQIERQEHQAGEEKTAPGHPTCFGHELIVKELGGEIVNAMNIQKLKSEDGLQPFQLVVLISNNDKTVKVYSLDQQKVLTVLEHGVPVNYASLSPDSRMLVTVGDANHVYFHRRINKATTTSRKSDTASPLDYEWTLIGTPAVPVYDSISDDFSFSIAFSPCGRLCAVSSQGGTISVFDMTAMDDLHDTNSLENAIICAFKSSRQPLFGCVRSMAFSPDPWGLLAWAEDHGRVGVADVRQFFVRRQIMKLDFSAPNVTNVEIEDATPSRFRGSTVKERLKAQHLQRLQQQIRSRSSADEMAATAWAEESRLRQNRRDLLSYHHGLELDARERSVLQALETTMDDIQQTMTPPAEESDRAIYVDPSGLEMPHPGRSSSSGSEEMAPAARTPESVQDERAVRGNRTDILRGSRPYYPRRRSSVVLSSSSTATLAPPADTSRHRLTASPSRIAHPENDHSDLPPLMLTNDLTPSRNTSSNQPLPYNIPTSEPVSLQGLTLPRTPPTDRMLLSHGLAGYPRTERPTSDRRYVGDPDFEADLEVHLSALSNRYGAAAALPSSAQTSAPATGTIANRVRRQEDTRRRQMAHIESLERQVRRTENRVAIASSEIEALENAIVNGVNGERHARITEARARARAAAAANAAVNNGPGPRNTATTTAILRDLETLRSGNIGSPSQTRLEAPAGRTTELTGRISENDMRLARLMIMSGARSAMDRNGNWVASARDAEAEQVTRPSGGAVNSLIEEAVREMGPGTAGVGWSPDGRYLYAGTEEGLFEYAVNLRDRMQFPACDMR